MCFTAQTLATQEYVLCLIVMKHILISCISCGIDMRSVIRSRFEFVFGMQLKILFELIQTLESLFTFLTSGECMEVSLELKASKMSPANV